MNRLVKRLLAATLASAGLSTGLAAQELDIGQMTLERYLTTADGTQGAPGGTVWSGAGSPPTSGSPTSFNDPGYGFNSTRYWAKDPQYSGVTQLIMTYQTKNLSTGAIGSAAFICSGAVINGGYSVLTAGHCVNNSTRSGTQYTLQSVQVRLGQHFGGNTTAEPGAGAPSVNQAFNFIQNVGASNVAIHPDYTGNVIDQRDIAVVNLNTPVPPTYKSYELFTHSALGVDYNIVGWGGRGNGALGTVNVGGSTGAGARIRQGHNIFDITYADPRWSTAFMNLLFGSRGPQDVYLADFDNGMAANDALCRLSYGTISGLPIWLGTEAERPCGLGQGIDEVGSAGGDSGGPSLVMGKIAAVTSFGQRWGSGFFGDVDARLNSSFGELNGMARVDINSDWVYGAVVSPEPSSMILLASGLVGLIGLARRRRQG